MTATQDFAPLRLPVWAWALAAVVAHTAFEVGSFGFWHWNVGMGLVFVALWLAPTRAGVWIVVAVALANTVRDLLWRYAVPEELVATQPPDGFLSAYPSFWMYFIAVWADPLLCLLPAAWLRHKLGRLSRVWTPEGTVWLHLAVVAAAALQTVTDVFWVLGEGFVADIRARAVVDMVPITAGNAVGLLAVFSLKNLLGYFLGAMLAAPIVVWGLHPALRRGSLPLLTASPWLIAVALGFVGLTSALPQAQLVEILRLLLLAVVVFSASHGWRGAALSLLIASVALAIEDHLHAATSPSVIWLQLFVAIMGALALMFGASLDHLRLALSDLSATQARERRVSQELVEAASRNARAAETERARVARDLHDSVGQGITALQTHLKLAELDAPPQGLPWLAGLRELIAGMRRALRESIEALRPAALSELGLVKAIDLGSIRQQAEAAGLTFSLSVHGERWLSALDDAAAVAAYRIVQEAVNNVVRHSGATQVAIRLRLGWHRGEPWLLICVRDEGQGIATARHGNGLTGMRDRVMTLGGGVRIDSPRAPGTRLRAWLRAHEG